MDRPWLAHYEEDVPHHLEHRPLCLHELLPEAARQFPGRAALICAVHAAGHVFHSEMKYLELQGAAERFAASLLRLGVAKGDRVGIFLPNCPQFVIAYLAAARVGAIAVPFNSLYSAREVEHQLKDCGAKVMVALSRFYPIVQKVRARTSLEKVIVARIDEHFPPVLKILWALTGGRKEPRLRLSPGDVLFRELLVPGEAPKPVEVHEDDTAVLLYTGGTTGVSKGVELSHRNLVTNARQNEAWGKIQPGREVTLVALPLFHAFGLTCGLNLGVLGAATMVLVPNPTDMRGVARIAHRFQPTIFPVVPTFLVGIGSLKEIARYDLRSVRVCPCAGSPLAPAVQRSFIEKTGIQVAEGYGLTEAAPVVMGNPPCGENRHGTTGTPYPDTEARVVDFETGTRDAIFEEGSEWSEPGEMIVRGPQVMKGYWNRPEDTAAQLKDGWLHTGDVAQAHRDGYFRIVDRLKDLIIRSGMKIYPAEIEAVLHEHPKVREVLVIGIPDQTRGQLVKAFVVARPDTRPTEEELLAFCRENLAKFKVPAAIELRESLVRSAVGKPLRRALREELALAAGAQG
jgi:long-chain acyl-CoA synthetase